MQIPEERVKKMIDQLTTALGPDEVDDGDQGRRQRRQAIAALAPIKKNRLGPRSYWTRLRRLPPYSSAWATLA